MVDKTVAVKLRAEVQQYLAGMKQAAAATSGLSSTAGRDLSRLGGGLQKVGVGAVGMAGLAGAALASFSRNASNLGESINAVNVTFGEAADGILRLGESAAESMGLSAVSFNAAAVQFSAFADQIAGPGGDVVDVVETITGRASDFASVMNIDVAEAMRLFQSGLAGETEPLRRFGIDLSAAAVEAHALETGISDGSGAMSESEKVMARYSLLLEQTAKTQGDFAATSDDAANAQRIFEARLENFKAALGAGVLPAMTGLLDVADRLLGVFDSLPEPVKEMIGTAALAGTGLLALGGSVSFLIGSLLKMRANFVSAGSAAADFARRLSGSAGLQAGLAGVGLAIAGAGALYATYSAKKEEAKRRTEEFTVALRAEAEGQRDAVAALIAGKLAEEDTAEAISAAGLTVSQVAAAIRGEHVPAVEAMLDVIDKFGDSGKLVRERLADLGFEYDANTVQGLKLARAIDELSAAHAAATGFVDREAEAIDALTPKVGLVGDEAASAAAAHREFQAALGDVRDSVVGATIEYPATKITADVDDVFGSAPGPARNPDRCRRRPAQIAVEAPAELAAT